MAQPEKGGSGSGSREHGSVEGRCGSGESASAVQDAERACCCRQVEEEGRSRRRPRRDKGATLARLCALSSVGFFLTRGSARRRERSSARKRRPASRKRSAAATNRCRTWWRCALDSRFSASRASVRPSSGGSGADGEGHDDANSEAPPVRGRGRGSQRHQAEEGRGGGGRVAPAARCVMFLFLPLSPRFYFLFLSLSLFIAFLVAHGADQTGDGRTALNDLLGY